MLQINYSRAYTCNDITPDYIEVPDEQYKCTKCGTWSEHVAISAELNEHYCIDCIEHKSINDYFKKELPDSDEGEIDDIIIELKNNYKNNVK